ncbi:hypothetical protein AN33_02629, partial [Mycobacterium tuberculosis M987]
MTQLPVSVPSRGFGSDDLAYPWLCMPLLVVGFPSPLGVLGLTT